MCAGAVLATINMIHVLVYQFQVHRICLSNRANANIVSHFEIDLAQMMRPAPRFVCGDVCVCMCVDAGEPRGQCAGVRAVIVTATENL